MFAGKKKDLSSLELRMPNKTKFKEKLVLIEFELCTFWETDIPLGKILVQLQRKSTLESRLHSGKEQSEGQDYVWSATTCNTCSLTISSWRESSCD